MRNSRGSPTVEGGGLESATILAEAISWQGRSEESEAILARFDPDGSDELLTARWGGLWAATLFFGCGRAEDARVVLVTVRQRVTEPLLLTIVTAMEVSFAYYGADADMESAIAQGMSALGTEMLPHSVVWVGMSVAGALAMAGRFADVAPVARRALAAAQRCESGPQRYLIGLAEMSADVCAGEFDAADRVCARYAGMASGVPQAEALVAALGARVDLARGRLASAAEAFRMSLSTTWDSLQTGLTMLVAAWLAQAESAHGDIGGAADALSGPNRRRGRSSRCSCPNS